MTGLQRVAMTPAVRVPAPGRRRPPPTGSTRLLSSHSCSTSFSPGRRPVKTISISSARNPDSRIRSVARSTMRTGSPMFSTKSSPPCANAARLQHEVHRLGDRHEEAGHVRMRDRDRAAARDLLPEERHDAAAAAEHVAEAHREEAPAASGGGIAHDHLRDPLGGPHDARRLHGLVGRDQHEALDAVRQRRTRRRSRAEHVVGDRFGRVRLHQRHVLVRGGVEDDATADASAKTRSRLLPVADVGDHRPTPRWPGRSAAMCSAMSKMLFSPWPTRTSVLAPASAICRQSSLPIEPPAPVTSTCWSAQVARRVRSRDDRPTPQQVGDVDLAQTRHAHAALEQLEHPRHDLGGDAGLPRRLHEAAQHRAGGLGHRNDHLVDVARDHDLAQLVEARQHAHALDRTCRASPRSSSRNPTGSRPSCGFRCISRTTIVPGLARADHQHTLALGRPPGRLGRRRAGLGEHAHGHAHAGDGKQRQQPVDGRHRSRVGRHRACRDGHERGRTEQHARHRDGRQDGQQIVEPDKAPVARVQPERVEDRQLHQRRRNQREAHRLGKVVVGRDRRLPVQTQHERPGNAQQHHKDVEDEDVAIAHRIQRAVDNRAAARAATHKAHAAIAIRTAVETASHGWAVMSTQPPSSPSDANPA